MRALRPSRRRRYLSLVMAPQDITALETGYRNRGGSFLFTASGLSVLNVVMLVGAMLLPYQHQRGPSVLLTPDAPEMSRRAPDLFHVRLETNKCVILLKIL